jgi:hypothetical protein
MNLEPIRAELMAQHTHLRDVIEDVRGGLLREAGREPLGAELRARMDELAGGLRKHNLREEELLRGVLATIDAWGLVREDIMSAQHVVEHEELAAALEATAMTETAVDSETVHASLDRLLQHMAREETMFLNEALLRDDGVVAEQFSG